MRAHSAAMKTPCFGYMRVSSDGQAGEDRDGLKRQQRAIQAFVKAKGLVLVETFADEGVSGTVAHNARPAFKKLLAALYGNGVKTVVVEDVDRLGRDAEVTLNAIGDFRRAGFTLLTTKGQELTSSSTDSRLKTGMDSVIAEYVRGQLVERLRSARMHKRMTDPKYKEGRKVFGSRPGERDTIARVEQMRASGMTLDDLAATLNAEGIPARKGRWHAKTVARVLDRLEVRS